MGGEGEAAVKKWRSRASATDDNIEAIRARDAAWEPGRGGPTNASRAARDRRLLLVTLDGVCAEVSRLVEDVKRQLNEAKRREDGGRDG